MCDKCGCNDGYCELDCNDPDNCLCLGCIEVNEGFIPEEEVKYV